MVTPSLQEALAALDAELGKSGARVRPGNPNRKLRRTRNPSAWVDWSRVAEWCFDHPGQAFTADPVHANAVYRLRKNFPELRVEGSNHRREDDGRRVATLFAVYDPPDDPNWVDEPPAKS